MNEKDIRKGPTFDEKESAEIARRYNIINAIRGQKPGEGQPDDGYEREISQEIASREGLSARAHSFFVPYAAVRDAITGVHNVAGKIVGNGAALVPTNLMAEESISPLAALCITGRVGARVIDGLRPGDFSIPVMELVEVHWIGDEAAIIPQTKPTWSGSIVGTCHECNARLDITRKMMYQTNRAAQLFVLSEIVNALTRAVDIAALGGSGNLGQPCGIVNADGVNVIEGITPGSVTAANIEAFIDAVETANADEDALAFVARTDVKKALRNLRRDYVEVKNGNNSTVGAVGGELIYKNRAMFDVPFLASNVAPKKRLICGDFSQLMLCGWGGDTFELQVNPFTLSASGATRLNLYKGVDVIVRNPDAFAVGQILENDPEPTPEPDNQPDNSPDNSPEGE